MILASKKGFGIVEVVIAVAIMSIIALGFSQMMNFQVQGQSAVLANEEIANTQKILSFAISNDYLTCHHQPFAGITFSTSLPAASQPAVAVPGGTLSYLLGGIPIASIVAPNNILGPGLTVTKIQIQPYSRINATTFIVQLQVVAQKKAGSVSGSNIFTASVPVSVQAVAAGAAATISDCTNGVVCVPPIWSSVGSGTESFCINTAVQPAATAPGGIFNAAQVCEGQDAHLCSSQEWLEACNFAGPGFDATTFQWIAPIYTGVGTPGNYAVATNQGFGGCMISGNVGGQGFNIGLAYRCCHK